MCGQVSFKLEIFYIQSLCLRFNDNDAAGQDDDVDDDDDDVINQHNNTCLLNFLVV